ncbi:MAG: hypothetical protein GY794_16145 [bacterium]|nr:hypothetical protein [bacterium]
MTQRIKEELQDIARELAQAAAAVPTNEQYVKLMDIVQLIREAGTLIPCDERARDAKRKALEAYARFTDLVNEGVLE